MTVPQQAEKLACLIVARNLGDAVIQSGFLKALVMRGYACEYIVWTRPQAAFLYRDISRCEVVCSEFPVGTRKQFGLKAAARFAAAARHIRARKASVSLDLIGDVRERLFARLAGSARLVHIGWAADHPFSRLIRNPFGRGRPQIEVPRSVLNIYAAYEMLLDALAPVQVPTTAGWNTPQVRAVADHPLRVGLHPFASQRCKLWPADNWRDLARALLAQDAEIYAFGAPAERPALMRLLGELAAKVHVVTESLQEFANRTATLDVMVGLDSFSTHMAARQGIRSITINAGNPPQLWAVPHTGTTLWSSGGCASYPCFNVPKCEGTVQEYACVKSVSVRQVIDSINQ
jgi:heptosyltransferase-3